MKNQTTIILVGLLAAIGIYIAVDKKNKNANQNPIIAETPVVPVIPSVPVVKPKVNTATVALNYNVLMFKGSRGAEVAKLQQLLKISADGVFGEKTERALYLKKGFRQMTLNQYNAWPDLNLSETILW